MERSICSATWKARDRGPAKKDCATVCAKVRNPIGIVNSKGNIYIAAGLDQHRHAHDVLVNKMSEEVTVTGTLVTKSGTKVLFIKSN